MTALDPSPASAPTPLRSRLAGRFPGQAWGRLVRADRVVLAFLLLLSALAIANPGQAAGSLAFTARALLAIAPWLAVSVAFAAWAKATGADRLVARAFAGREGSAVALAALVGALSPFCSCGVIPLVAGLLAGGVPLAPVMAFWIASPLMDPNQFLLLAGTIGPGFAVAKTAAAIGIGLAAGFATLAVTRAGGFADVLKVKTLGPCAARAALRPPPPAWRFWDEAPRRRVFAEEAGRSAWFLLRWLALAFLIESLMLAWVPGETIARLLGGEGPWAVPLAVLLGVPAYLNGFAAIPLVDGLIGLGMSPAVGLAFMVAGGVTSVPAMLAVWALVRARVFALYLAFAAMGALAAGWAYALVLAAA